MRACTTRTCWIRITIRGLSCFTAPRKQVLLATWAPSFWLGSPRCHQIWRRTCETNCDVMMLTSSTCSPWSRRDVRRLPHFSHLQVQLRCLRTAKGRCSAITESREQTGTQLPDETNPRLPVLDRYVRSANNRGMAKPQDHDLMRPTKRIPHVYSTNASVWSRFPFQVLFQHDRLKLEPYDFVERREWWTLPWGPPWWARCFPYGRTVLNMAEVPGGAPVLY